MLDETSRCHSRNWRIWQKSVSFNNHHTAATACSLTTLQGLINSELRKPMTSSLEAAKQSMIAKRFSYLNSALYQSLPQRVFDAVNW
jgi:hypothetical protein